MRRWVPISTAVFLGFSLACSGIGKKASEETESTDPEEQDTQDEDTSEPEEEFDPLTLDAITVEWQNNGGSIIIDHPAVTAFTLGIAGTYEGWMGEDCFEGDGEYLFCHTFDASGGDLETVDDPDDIIEGETTLFDRERSEYEGQDWLTYWVEIASDHEDFDGNCYVWGQYPGVFADLECEELE